MTVHQSDNARATSWTYACVIGLVVVVKGIGGLIGGSQALLADALSSASDAVRGTRSGSRLSVGIKLLVITLIIVGAVESSIVGVKRLLDGPEPAPTLWAFGSFFVAVVVSEGLFLIRYRRQFQQDRVAAKQYASEHRSSLYASMLVAIGMALAIVGNGFDILILQYADPFVALLVAILVIVKVLQLASSLAETVSSTTNDRQAVDPTPFIETVQRIQGVIEVRSLKAYESIETVEIELVLSVNPRMTVKEAEEIAQRSRDLLMHRFVQVIEAHVRVEPYHTGYPYKSNAELPESGEQSTIIQ